MDKRHSPKTIYFVFERESVISFYIHKQKLRLETGINNIPSLSHSWFHSFFQKSVQSVQKSVQKSSKKFQKI